MPIYKAKVLGASQFTGASAALGLFVPPTGSNSIQVRVNSLTFHCGQDTDFTLYQLDPSDPSNATRLLAETSIKDIYMTQIWLPVSDKVSHALACVTTTKTDDGWFTVDYDFEATEGA